MGDRRRREWARLSPHATRVGSEPARPVRRGRRAVLLQAVGRAAHGGRHRARRGGRQHYSLAPVPRRACAAAAQGTHRRRWRRRGDCSRKIWVAAASAGSWSQELARQKSTRLLGSPGRTGLCHKAPLCPRAPAQKDDTARCSGHVSRGVRRKEVLDETASAEPAPRRPGYWRITVMSPEEQK